ncbi:DNA mismatch repair endonuclease MutL [Rubrivirga sp.]|uniref:DNA mismatch repair endonuclease MutL n=1 Tax=Rubrivirga sp. TaxID=1885344 RepID=UPI003B51850D
MPPDAATDGLVQALPDTLASKIAAGEVVQRPANALKELVENALDAGASSVEVVLKKAGSELIQVADDGCGMGPADAVASFGRHATSKLRRFEDLERLRTLGFRGEALASIASVAQVELKTRRRGDETATCVRVHGGEVVDVAPCAAPVGTCLSVRNLFYNVPARRAFLKSPATEFKHLVEAFQALALSHPAVAFSLVHDDTEVWRLPAHDGADALDVRLNALAGGGLDGALVAVEEATSYLSVRGLVASPDRARRSRGEQYLFINGRFVKSRPLDHAVAGAFGALLPERQHALYALFLDVDPRHVDVNVHPTKTEVKFDDDRGVYSFVKAVVKRSLAESGLGLSFDPGARPVGAGARPSFLDAAPASTRDAAGEEESPVTPITPPAGDGARGPVLPPSAPTVRLEAGSGADAMPPARPVQPEPGPAPGPPLVPDAPTGPIPARLGTADVGDDLEMDGLSHPSGDDLDRTFWQLHGRYLLSPVRSGLLVVDQRAAHERILYERALATMASGMSVSQQLLFPFTVDLGAADRALLGEILPDLSALGFQMEAPEGKPVLVRGVPADVTLGDEREVLDDLLAQFRRNARFQLSARENLARSMAARSAIRPGHPLGPTEARLLVDQLFGCDDPFSDPAGRPTMTRWSTDEIERRFRPR